MWTNCVRWKDVLLQGLLSEMGMRPDWPAAAAAAVSLWTSTDLSGCLSARPVDLLWTFPCLADPPSHWAPVAIYRLFPVGSYVYIHVYALCTSAHINLFDAGLARIPLALVAPDRATPHPCHILLIYL